MNQTLTILHLSDLHFREGQDFDRSVVLDPLLERINKDSARGFLPELIIVSGDIAFSGKKEQYALAHTFLEDLLSTCLLTKDRLFLVPGNHDVDRDEYRPTDNPHYDDMKTLNTELEKTKYRNQLFAGMQEYFTFVNTHYSHLKSIHNTLVPFVCTFPSSCGMNIGLIGLNSAWMCRQKNEHPGIIAIGEYQVKKAFKELAGMEPVDITICTFHHPLSWLWSDDRKIVRMYLNNTMVLTGHLHEPEGVLAHDLEGRVWQFQAGGIKDMMILGDPGSGKTTLLKDILIMLCEAKVEEKLGISSSLIPFFAPLRMWTRDTGDFFSFMAKTCLLEQFGITKQTFESLLKKGSALILLDGLDEAGDKQKRAKLIRQLESVRRQYPDTHFIFTSRFAGYIGDERLKGNILDLTILDFTLEQIRAFLYTWFSAVEDALHPGEKQWQDKARKDAKNLISRIEQSQNLINFVKNPLILQITALVHRDRGTLPERRVELYDECTNVLLEKWDMAKGLHVPVTARGGPAAPPAPCPLASLKRRKTVCIND